MAQAVASSSKSSPKVRIKAKGKAQKETDLEITPPPRRSLRSSPREKTQVKVVHEAVTSSDSGSEFGGDDSGSSESEVESEEEVDDGGEVVPVTAEAYLKTVEETIVKTADVEEDEEDHFETPVKATQRNKRVIESDSSELSAVEINDSDELEIVKPVVRRKKAAPKKPKYDFFGGHPELLTVWSDLDGTQEPTDIRAEQPKDIVLKV
jgi:DNA-binding protein H-NS